MEFEVTSLSSRGQVVIPQNIREQLGLKEGEKFMVVGEKNTIILKRIEFSFDGVDELLEKTRAWAKERQISRRDVDEAVRASRR
jgi:AbrB family looped-hinge helix DNA binding protein